MWEITTQHQCFHSGSRPFFSFMSYSISLSSDFLSAYCRCTKYTHIYIFELFQHIPGHLLQILCFPLVVSAVPKTNRLLLCLFSTLQKKQISTKLPPIFFVATNVNEHPFVCAPPPTCAPCDPRCQNTNTDNKVDFKARKKKHHECWFHRLLHRAEDAR